MTVIGEIKEIERQRIFWEDKSSAQNAAYGRWGSAMVSSNPALMFVDIQLLLRAFWTMRDIAIGQVLLNTDICSCGKDHWIDKQFEKAMRGLGHHEK